MDQAEWRKWRHKGLGGSDAPIVMGVSEWKTPLGLFEEKILPEPLPEQSNFVTDRGHRYEPKIRSLYSFMEGIDFEPALLVMAAFDFLRVSLDGRSACGKHIIEIKTAGKEKHEQARQGKVPECYWPQVQHELMVSGAEVCHYISYYDENWDENNVMASNVEVVKVHPDKEYQAKLLAEEVKFWTENVLKKKPPAPSSDDYKVLRGHAKLAEKWKRLKRKEAEVAAELEEVREELIKAAEESKHPRCEVAGIRVVQVAKEGNVNWKKVQAEHLAGVDLDQYRGKGSIYWKLDLI